MHEIVVAAGEIAVRALDLDDTGAGIGEPARAHRRCDGLFERDDDKAGEGESHLRNAPLVVMAGLVV